MIRVENVRLMILIFILLLLPLPLPFASSPYMVLKSEFFDRLKMLFFSFLYGEGAKGKRRGSEGLFVTKY